MGWFGTTETDLGRFVKDELLGPEESDVAMRAVVAHAFTQEGGYLIMWSVVEMTAVKELGVRPSLRLNPGQKFRFIRCDLIEHRNGGWMYKPMDESMGPCYYSCPLSLLEQAPMEHNAGWRDKVRAYHRAHEVAA